MLKHYIASFWARNLTTYRVFFFVYHRGQKLFSSQTVFEQWQSSLDLQFNWKSPWLGWKAIYVQTLYSGFLSAKFDNVSSTFFVHHLGQKFFPSQIVLKQWHSSLDPQFIWISPWLGWKAIYVETLYSEFLSAKFDNVSSIFLYNIEVKNSFPVRLYQTVTLLPRSSIHLNKSLTRMKSKLCWDTI